MDKSKIKKVVLAYSGGIDTSIIIPWLKENYNNCEVIAVTGNVGQTDELEGLEEKAIKTGASKCYIEDLTEEFYVYKIDSSSVNTAGNKKRVKEYISSWKKSEMYKALEKARVAEIKPPIKKTNVILKNTNFQLAVRLWDYLRMYDLEDNENIRDNLNKEQNELIKFIDQSFLKNYCVLDSISKLKSTQKHKMTDYLVLMLLDEIETTLDMIRSCGYDMSDEQLLTLLLKEVRNKKNDRLVGSDDVKKRFKSAMDEYLERMQDCI